MGVWFAGMPMPLVAIMRMSLGQIDGLHSGACSAWWCAGTPPSACSFSSLYMTFVPSWRVETMRASRILARCWETAAGDMCTISARALLSAGVPRGAAGERIPVFRCYVALACDSRSHWEGDSSWHPRQIQGQRSTEAKIRPCSGKMEAKVGTGVIPAERGDLFSSRDTLGFGAANPSGTRPAWHPAPPAVSCRSRQ